MKVSFILDGCVKLLANSSPGITVCFACRAVLSLTSFIDSPEEMGINDVFRLLVAKCLKIQFKIAKLSLMWRHNTGSSFEVSVSC